MARINIEDKWWADPRRVILIKKLGNEDLVDGQMVRLIRTAQHYWCDYKNQKALIPKEVFLASEFNEFFVSVGLVIEKDNGFYLSGSEHHFDWFDFEFTQKKSQAGKKSAESRVTKYGTAIPVNASNNRTETEQAPNTVRTPSEQPPNSLSLSLSLSQSLSLSLNKELNKNTNTGQKKPKEPMPDGLGPVISAYRLSFRKRYNSDPLIEDKEIVTLKAIIKSVGKDRALILVQVYLQMDTKWFKEKNHDLFTLRGNIQKVLVAMNTGIDPDRKEDMFSLLNKSKEVQL